MLENNASYTLKSLRRRIENTERSTLSRGEYISIDEKHASDHFQTLSPLLTGSIAWNISTTHAPFPGGNCAISLVLIPLPQTTGYRWLRRNALAQYRPTCYAFVMG